MAFSQSDAVHSFIQGILMSAYQEPGHILGTGEKQGKLHFTGTWNLHSVSYLLCKTLDVFLQFSEPQFPQG